MIPKSQNHRLRQGDVDDLHAVGRECRQRSVWRRRRREGRKRSRLGVHIMFGIHGSSVSLRSSSDEESSVPWPGASPLVGGYMDMKKMSNSSGEGVGEEGKGGQERMNSSPKQRCSSTHQVPVSQ